MARVINREHLVTESSGNARKDRLCSFFLSQSHLDRMMSYDVEHKAKQYVQQHSFQFHDHGDSIPFKVNVVFYKANGPA